MPTYTFRGRDMSEAVEQVRIMLGSDAVIIDTLRGTDHIGRFVEITATGELKAPPTAPFLRRRSKVQCAEITKGTECLKCRLEDLLL